MACEWKTHTLIDALRQSASQYPDNVALVDRSSRLTYRILLEQVESIAGYLIDIGVSKSDRVVLQLPNSALFEIVCFALFSIGALPVLVLPMHREHVIAALCRNSQPVAYITAKDPTNSECWETGERIANTCDSIKVLIYDEELRSVLEDGTAVARPHEEPKPCDLAFLSLSGGTTGVPKLIGRTHGEYYYNALITTRHCRMGERTVMLTALPAAHNFSLGTPGMIGTVLCAGTNVMCENPSPIDMFEWIARERVTITSMVPTVSNLCVRYRTMDTSDDISSLRYFLVGGAVYTSDQAREAEDVLGARVVQVYGMAEGRTFLTDLDAPEEVRHFTQGRPCCPEDIFRIVDENFQDVPDGMEGEVVVKGPYTIKRYYNDIPANKESFIDGFYRPGDKGVRLATGDIRITGRVKEQINRAGEKVMPSEVESVMMGIAAIEECAVVGVADELLGMAVHAFYLSEHDLDLNDVIAFLRSVHVEDCCIPDAIHRIESWPLTAVGKIDRNKLKGWAAQNDN